MAGCSMASCGMCGRCTESWEDRREQPECRFCDRCGLDVFHPITLPFGTFCSHACADLEEVAFAERMQRRGFQKVLG